MDSAEIAKRWGCKVGDVVALYGNAYQVTFIGNGMVLGHQTVENGHEVCGTMVFRLNLKMNGWQLIL